MKIDWFEENMPNMVDEAKQLFLEAVSGYKIQVGRSTDCFADLQLHEYNNDDTPLGPSEQPTNHTRDDCDMSQSAAGILGLNQTCRRQGNTTLDRKVQWYYDDIECGEDMLTYWQVSLHLFLTVVTISQFMTQEHHNQYPTIFKLAMDILPIQGSAVPCEQVFLSAKETITAHRNKISPELMEALQILKYSIKHGRPLDFTSHHSWKERMDELEVLIDDIVNVPHDYKDYQARFVR